MEFIKPKVVGIMRKHTILLSVAFLFLTSCKNDEGLLPLAPAFVTKIKAYDLDNNGNSSDIRVDFSVTHNLNITEYRVMVVPFSLSNSFNGENALALPEERYLEIVPKIFDNKYSITRLPSNLFDVNGGQILVNLEYVVAVLVVGTGYNQLSEYSRPFRLKDRAIYSGDYEGMRDVDLTLCCASSSNCKCNDCDAKMITSTINEVEGKYTGLLICQNCDGLLPDASLLSFIITNNTLSDLSVQQTDKCYGYGPCIDCTPDVDPCNAIFPGQGKLVSELAFEISYSGDDCVGSHKVTLFLTRQ